jgi:hypothetical protein
MLIVDCSRQGAGATKANSAQRFNIGVGFSVELAQWEELRK